MASYSSVDDPSAHVQAVTWSGNDTQDTAITFNGNSNLKPDLFINKGRGIAYGFNTMDTSRGIGNSGKVLRLNLGSGNQEFDIDDYFETADTNGFTIGRGDASFNAANDTYITWGWKANGGTTSTNSDGDINTTIQNNSDAGFSIIQYSPSNNTARNIGHGLGGKPAFVIFRARNRSEDWRIYHQSAATTGGFMFDNSAYNTTTTLVTGSTTSTIGLGTDYSVNGNYNYIAYAWKEVPGFSSFGSYYGNGNANGNFCYTGFKPSILFFKCKSTTGNWLVFDSARGLFNLNDNYFYLNSNAAEATSSSSGVDFYSNGFKMRNTYNDANANGEEYCYAAWAEHPIVTSSGSQSKSFFRG